MDKHDFKLLKGALRIQVCLVVSTLLLAVKCPKVSPRAAACFIAGAALLGSGFLWHAITTIRRFYETGELPARR